MKPYNGRRYPLGRLWMALASKRFKELIKHLKTRKYSAKISI
jgi:hypothetical protein